MCTNDETADVNRLVLQAIHVVDCLGDWGDGDWNRSYEIKGTPYRISQSFDSDIISIGDQNSGASLLTAHVPAPDSMIVQCNEGAECSRLKKVIQDAFSFVCDWEPRTRWTFGHRALD